MIQSRLHGGRGRQPEREEGSTAVSGAERGLTLEELSVDHDVGGVSPPEGRRFPEPRGRLLQVDHGEPESDQSTLTLQVALHLNQLVGLRERERVKETISGGTWGYSAPYLIDVKHNASETLGLLHGADSTTRVGEISLYHHRH